MSFFKRIFTPPKPSGSSSPAPVNTADNLRSNDKVEVMLALCHGPIKGLADGQKTFFVDETPLVNADNSSNFLNVNLRLHQGFNPGETIRPLLGGYEDFRGVYANLAPATPFTFTTQTPGIRSIVLRFEVQKLWRRAVSLVAGRFPSDGITTHRADFTIAYRHPGGVWVDPYNGEGYAIFGKTDTSEVHEVRFETTAPGPFEIRVTQNTQDQLDAPCKIRLEGYYEVAQGQYGLTRSNAVGVQLAPNTPVTRTTQQPPERVDGTIGIDMLDLRLVVQQLFISNTSGTFEDEIEVLIEVKRTSSTSWTSPFGGPVKIRGKTSGSPYVSEYRVPVTRVDDTYDVRVTRVSGDLPDHFREISWESLQEIVGGPARFDGVAVVQLSARASNQFSSLPQFTGIYDLKLCKVPTNYNPITRTYTGAWDGTFKLEWTDNPAWCWYDLAMDDVYGARQFWPELSVDRYSVYEAAQWCDEPVSDGRGGTQPRWTCNGLIAEGRGVKDQLRYMAGIFNAVPVDQLNGQIRLSVDKNTEAVALFTPENVTDGEFEYSYTDITTRYNEVTARFINKSLDYSPDSRVVKDAEHQALYGRIPFEFAAVNCRDPREAFRRAVYRLLTATTEVESVSFRTNRRGLLIEVFDTILVADPDMGRALTGRIASLSTDRRTVSFRDPVYLEPNVSYEMAIDIPSNAVPRGTTSETYTLTGSYSGYVTSVTLTQALPAGLPSFMPFALGAAGGSIGAPKPYRVTEIVEEEGTPDSIRIVAMEVNRNKQFIADNATAKGGIIQINLPGTLPPPTNLTATTTLVEIGLETKAMVRLAWTAPGDPRVLSYRVQFRESGEETWRDAGSTRSTSFSIYDLPVAIYDFRVGSTSGADASWVELLAQEAGIGTRPSDVTGLIITTVWDSLQLDWTPVPDLDLSHYEVRYDPVAIGATWQNAQTLVERATSSTVTVPWAPGAYFVKAVDQSGVESLNAAVEFVLASAPGVLSGLTAVGTVRAISLSWSLPNDPYLDAIEIYEGTTNDPHARYFIGEVGRVTGYLRSELMPNQTRFYWVRTRSRRGTYSDFLGPASATTSLLVAADIQDGILNTAKFASSIEPVSLVTSVPTTKSTEVVFNKTDGKLYRWNGTAYTAEVPAADVTGALAAANFPANLRPPEIVTSLPSSGNFEGRMVYLTTDDKLYRWTSPTVTTGTTHWTSAVAAADISGTLTDAQIAAVAAGKVTGQLTDAQIAAVAAAKVTGQIADSQIAGVDAAKLSGTINEARISSLDAAKLSGTINEARIASLAATKVTGQITGTQISDNAISAPKIAAGAIEASKIAAGAVQAGSIAAGAVTADKIAANSVSASKLLISDTQNLLLNGDFAYGSEDWSRITGSVVRVTGFDVPSGAPTPACLRMTRVTSENSISQGGRSFHNDTDFQYGVPCNVGDQFYAEGWFFSSVAGTQTCFDAVIRLNSGVVAGLSGSVVLGSRSLSAETWSRVGVVFTATQAGRIYLRLWNGINDSILHVARVRFQRRNAGELIVDGAVSAAKIAAEAVSADKLTANAVTADKIAANAVTAAKIDAAAVTAEKVAASAITADKIAANAVTAAKIQAGAVEAAKIAAGAISADKIAAGAISADKIAANAVTSDKIDANAITANKIAAGAITAGAIAANVISADKLVAGAVTAEKIATNAITSDKIAANAITAGKISAGAISTTELAAGAVRAGNLASETLITQAAQLGTAVVGAAQIANAAITNAKIGNLEVDTIKIAGGSVSNTVGGAWNGDYATTTPGTAISIWVGDGFGGIYALYIRAIYAFGEWSTTNSDGQFFSGFVQGRIRLWRNGSLISEYVAASDLTRVIFDSGSGAHNYQVQIFSDAPPYSGSLARFFYVELYAQYLKR